MTYIIAEIGVNHDGSLQKAHRLIDAAADAGADAVKFQTYRADELAIPGPHRDMLAKYQMPLDWYPELKKHADDRLVCFFSSAFDLESALFLYRLGVPWIKIPSGENNNLPLVKMIKGLGLDIIISDGLGGIPDDVQKVLDIENDIILRCVSNYPADIRDYALEGIWHMKKYSGISDHTIGPALGIAAAALELSTYEKHITLSCKDQGPDHAASMEIDEFAKMVHDMRSIDGAMLNKKCPGNLPDNKTAPRARRVMTPEGLKRNP